MMFRLRDKVISIDRLLFWETKKNLFFQKIMSKIRALSEIEFCGLRVCRSGNVPKNGALRSQEGGKKVGQLQGVPYFLTDWTY